MVNLISTSKLFQKLSINNNRHQIIQYAFKSTKSESEIALDLEDDGKLPPSTIDQYSAVLIPDEEAAQLREQEIEQNRNISKLLPQHQNKLHNKRPYTEPQSWIHKTLKYNRMQFGRYGLASGVDARLCFPTKKELAVRVEYERVAFPKTIQQMMVINENDKQETQRKIREREENISKKLLKLNDWTKEVNEKVAKREAVALAAKERKDRIIEEVRRQFGFKMDNRDERFKELLAQKEKEDKKKQKEVKRKVKEDKMLAKLQEQHNLDLNLTSNSSSRNQPKDGN